MAFLKGFKKGSGDKVTVSFAITVHYVSDLPSGLNGSEIFVEIRRGSKSENQANTQKKIAARDAKVIWDEKVNLGCTFNYNKDKKMSNI